MTAQVTGGNPRTTGIYYDDEYSHAVLPAGTTSCHGQPTGGEVIYDSPDDINANVLDAGQGLSGLPGKHPANDRPAAARCSIRPLCRSIPRPASRSTPTNT